MSWATLGRAMTDPATPHRAPRLIPFGEDMSGVLVTVQLVPPGPEPDQTRVAEAGQTCCGVEPPPSAEAR
jgi:hypothetical protein